jgi:hypothetical protein
MSDVYSAWKDAALCETAAVLYVRFCTLLQSDICEAHLAEL